MRLVKITHSRCGEWDGAEHMLAPDWMSEAEIATHVRAVQEEMLADAKEVFDSPKSVSYHPAYADHPDLTVKQVQELHERQKAEYAAWLEENKRLTAALSDRLIERGFKSLWNEENGAIEVALDWGHNHGLKLNYQHSTV